MLLEIKFYGSCTPDLQCPGHQLCISYVSFVCEVKHMHQEALASTVNSLLKDTLSSGRLRYEGHLSRHQLMLLHYIYSLNKGHSLYKGRNHWNQSVLY